MEGGEVASGRKMCSFLETSVFETQVLVGPMGSVRIEGEERSEPSAEVQHHGCMAGEAQTKYVRREGG